MSDRQMEPPTAAVRRRMQRTKQRDTEVEMAIRRAVYRRGLRYRVDQRPTRSVRSRADLVFAGPRVAVYIDGCFWHSCPLHGTRPKKNMSYWSAKLQANRDRDQRVDDTLRGEGWLVLRIWEHEDPEEAAQKIEGAVRSRC